MGMQFQDFVMVASDQTNARLFIFLILEKLRYNSLVLLAVRLSIPTQHSGKIVMILHFLLSISVAVLYILRFIFAFNKQWK